MAGSCEYGNEYSLSIKCWEFLEWPQLHGVSYLTLRPSVESSEKVFPMIACTSGLQRQCEWRKER
jgi:hypothetical protein